MPTPSNQPLKAPWELASYDWLCPWCHGNREPLRTDKEVAISNQGFDTQDEAWLKANPAMCPDCFGCGQLEDFRIDAPTRAEVEKVRQKIQAALTTNSLHFEKLARATEEATGALTELEGKTSEAEMRYLLKDAETTLILQESKKLFPELISRLFDLPLSVLQRAADEGQAALEDATKSLHSCPDSGHDLPKESNNAGSKESKKDASPTDEAR